MEERMPQKQWEKQTQNRCKAQGTLTFSSTSSSLVSCTWSNRQNPRIPESFAVKKKKAKGKKKMHAAPTRTKISHKINTFPALANLKLHILYEDVKGIRTKANRSNWSLLFSRSFSSDTGTEKKKKKKPREICSRNHQHQQGKKVCCAILTLQSSWVFPFCFFFVGLSLGRQGYCAEIHSRV